MDALRQERAARLFFTFSKAEAALLERGEKALALVFESHRAQAAETTRDILAGYVTRGTQYDTWSTYQGQYPVTSRGKCMEGYCSVTSTGGGNGQ